MASSIITESFTYYLPEVPASEIDPNALEHSYFAQVAPDGRRLVPGLLQQGERPTIGNWMNVGYVDRDFPRRYFVQYTDFNTLVPGSLIQADRFPEGKWKEVKKTSFAEFRRVVFNPEFTVSIHDDHVNPTTFLYPNTFIEFYLFPVLNVTQPGVYSASEPASVQLFHFAGTFEELDNDASRLSVFANPDSYFTLHLDVEDIETSFLTTDQTWTGFEYFNARPATPDGYYSLVVKVLSHGNTPAYYIVMENLFRRYDFPYD